mmetsp:Transcript_11028/g.9973  ORF Transcript_11028/g.9973 Transcript_11028/m.9973 type:complete len:83 (-) Transcript_11028:831-1079(-)
MNLSIYYTISYLSNYLLHQDVDPFEYKSEALVDALVDSHTKLKQLLIRLFRGFLLVITAIVIFVISLIYLFFYNTKKNKINK